MSIRFEVKVVPSSGRMQCLVDKNDTFKCYIKAPAEKGKANKELVAFLSKKMKIPQRYIEVVAGKQSRNKIIHIDYDVTLHRVCEVMGFVKQQNLFEKG